MQTPLPFSQISKAKEKEESQERGGGAGEGLDQSRLSVSHVLLLAIPRIRVEGA